MREDAENFCSSDAQDLSDRSLRQGEAWPLYLLSTKNRTSVLLVPDHEIDSGPAALILCGGASRRMGRDKALLPFGQDATLLERVVRVVGQQVESSDIVVVAAPNQELPQLPDKVAVVTDRRPDEGPLMGIATGMAALRPDKKWTLVCSCDLPLLDPGILSLLSKLAKHSDSACEAVIPRVDGKWQPLVAIYQTRLVTVVHDLLRRGRRRVSDLLEAITVRELSENQLREVDSKLLSFVHCNTPEEYASLVAGDELT